MWATLIPRTGIAKTHVNFAPAVTFFRPSVFYPPSVTFRLQIPR
jgi:hypothetical protein